MSLENGGFAVAFQSQGQDGNGFGTYLKFYDANGQATSSEILVNTTVQGNQTFSGEYGVKSLDILPTGELVAVWQSDESGNYDIYAQKFNQDGTKVGGEYLVNTVTEGEQVSGNVAVSQSGDIGIVWESQSATDGTFQVKLNSLTMLHLQVTPLFKLPTRPCLVDQQMNCVQ